MKKVETPPSFVKSFFFLLVLSLLAFWGQARAAGEVSALPAPSSATVPEKPAPDTAAPDVVVNEDDAKDSVPQKENPAETSASSTPGKVPASGVIEPPPSSPPSKLPTDDSGHADLPGVMGDSGVAVKNSGTYYDSSAVVPDRDLEAAGAVGPRRIDPLVEPAQKFVTVTTNASSSSYEAQFVAATRALKLGRYAAAMEMFEKLHKKNRRDPRILMGLAVSQQGAGFRESASKTYEDLLSVQPNNADAIINLMGLMKDQYPSVTLKRLSELANKYPSNPGIPAQMGLINASEKNYDEAIRHFQVAMSMDPRNSSHVYNMAIVTDRKGNVKEAIRLYEQALQMDSTYGDAATALPREEIYDRLAVLRRKV